MKNKRSSHMSTKRSGLVTGATGQQGGAVARALLSRGHRVKALTRKPDSDAARQLMSEGADLVTGDLGETASVLKAASGVGTMFLMGNSYEAGTEEETRQGIIAAEAAKDAGVGHLIYSSVADANKKTGIPHFASISSRSTLPVSAFPTPSARRPPSWRTSLRHGRSVPYAR